jgi:hypothetical protein
LIGLVEDARDAIRAGSFDGFAEEFLGRYASESASSGLARSYATYN